LTIDAVEVAETVGAGVAVLTNVRGKRCVGVDEPNAITVDLACTTRLTRTELVSASIQLSMGTCLDLFAHSSSMFLPGLARNND
jgi:hypothetical protein